MNDEAQINSDYIQASDIHEGMRVVDEEGQEHTVTKISRGFDARMLMLQWRGGWGCVWPDDMILKA